MAARVPNDKFQEVFRDSTVKQGTRLSVMHNFTATQFKIDGKTGRYFPDVNFATASNFSSGETFGSLITSFNSALKDEYFLTFFKS